MDERIKKLLMENGIEYSSAIPMDESLVTNRRMFERSVSAFARTIIVFLAPYRACSPEMHNVSVYAAPRDYHLYMDKLFETVIPQLEKLFPGNIFKGMSDVSPINETAAAARAGLGVIGDNTRLINEKYGSYVFIGEIYTDAEAGASDPAVPGECLHCGRCAAACPAEFGVTCLSAITQKKGELTDAEISLIKRSGSAWGCDVCQDVCPMNEGKAYTGIEFFKTDLIFSLDSAALDSMPDKEFRERAFSWRGRKTPLRNLKILEE